MHAVDRTVMTINVTQCIRDKKHDNLLPLFIYHNKTFKSLLTRSKVGLHQSSHGHGHIIISTLLFYCEC